MRKAHGPCASGRLAAWRYARKNGQLSRTWDWAAQHLSIANPGRLIRMTLPANLSRVPDIAPTPSPKPTRTGPYADILHVGSNATVAKPVSPSPALASALNQPGPVKPAPPVPAVDVSLRSANWTLAMTAPPSPVASPVPTPSEPFTATFPRARLRPPPRATCS